MLKKKKIEKFGEHYLLGVNYAGEKVWLEKESWDCGWYWGFGYLHTYTNERNPERSRDIDSHFHFDSAFLKGPENAYDEFKGYFEDTVLTDAEIWELVDLMKTAYTLKTMAELYHRGYSHYTERAGIEALKDPEKEKDINERLLPQVFERIRALLSPAEVDD